MTETIIDRQSYAVTLETYWRDIWLDMSFLEKLYCDALGFRSISLLDEQGDFRTGMKRRLDLRRPMSGPAMLTKLFGGELSMEEESDFDPATQRWRYRLIPARARDRVEMHGTMVATSTAQGVEVRSTDHVVFKMIGFSGPIEKFMAEETRAGRALRAAFTRRYIEQAALR